MMCGQLLLKNCSECCLKWVKMQTDIVLCHQGPLNISYFVVHTRSRPTLHNTDIVGPPPQMPPRSQKKVLCDNPELRFTAEHDTTPLVIRSYFLVTVQLQTHPSLLWCYRQVCSLNGDLIVPSLSSHGDMYQMRQEVKGQIHVNVMGLMWSLVISTFAMCVDAIMIPKPCHCDFCMPHAPDRYTV